MARTILYSARPATPSEGGITFGGPADAEPEAGIKVATRDDYTGKLVKLVPAEVLAFFAPTAAAVEGKNVLLIAATAIAFLATPAYLWCTAQKLPPEKKPFVHLYPLSALAFLAWALSTSSIGLLMGLNSVATSFILAVSVFLIPLVDGVLEGMRK